MSCFNSGLTMIVTKLLRNDCLALFNDFFYILHSLGLRLGSKLFFVYLIEKQFIRQYNAIYAS